MDGGLRSGFGSEGEVGGWCGGESEAGGEEEEDVGDCSGEGLTDAEIKILVESCQRHRTKKQINLGKVLTLCLIV